jgi:hypothetical protein
VRDLRVDQVAVLSAMLPDAQRADGLALALLRGRGDVLLDGLGLFRRVNVTDRHREEFVAGIPTVTDGGVVDGEDGQRFLVVDPHRLRVVVEEQPILLLAASQRGLRLLRLPCPTPRCLGQADGNGEEKRDDQAVARITRGRGLEGVRSSRGWVIRASAAPYRRS